VTGPRQAALAQFVGQLRRLRQLAGSPSLNRLAALTAHFERPLPRSTISDKLSARSLPEWDFVVSFVLACRSHAEESGVSVPADLVDLAHWDLAHLTMLRTIDDAGAEGRLAATARAEIGRRGAHARPAPHASLWPAVDRDRRVVPRQLPPAVRHFAGRVAEVKVMEGLLDEAADAGGTVVITAIDGTAGIGKTAMAVHWAHRVAGEFPDGQLYVNLRGFDPAGSVMAPAEAVRRFLDALGVPAERIPVDLDAQAALYRSELAGRRMLVVLDNARDTAQVRPLLPGAPGCLVLVTSRNQLSGLVAADGAHPITLDVLSVAEARELLAHRLGHDRTAAEPEAVAEIITACARLPLALAIVAARAATHPHLSLQTLAGELHDTQGRLDTLSTDDPYTDVRAVFSWSYHALSPAAARLFRLLGLHPGPDISAAAAASLAGLPPARVPPLLAELTRAHLTAEHCPGRYAFHDLLRAYATERAHTSDPDEQRRAATTRMLDHYLHTAHTAERLLYPQRDPIVLTPINPGVVPERLSDHRQALHWFGMEHPVLLATVDHAAATGLDCHTWQLAWTLTTFLRRRGLWHDWAAVQRAALAAAQRLGDPTAQAQAHRGLADAYTRLRRYDDAHAHGRHALDLYAKAGDLAWQAHTHSSLAFMWERQGRHREALDHARQALELSRAGGHRIGQARALSMIGWLHTQLGDHQQAITTCHQALALLQEIDDRHGQADAWDSLGYAHHHLRRYAQAITCYQHALDLLRDLSERYDEAETLTRLGDTHRAAGNLDAARHTWQQALSILDQLDHPDAEQVRTKLVTINRPLRERSMGTE
jgi:tetratricopeptide (TPR) repeat protein